MICSHSLNEVLLIIFHCTTDITFLTPSNFFLVGHPTGIVFTIKIDLALVCRDRDTRDSVGNNRAMSWVRAILATAFPSGRTRLMATTWLRSTESFSWGPIIFCRLRENIFGRCWKEILAVLFNGLFIRHCFIILAKRICSTIKSTSGISSFLVTRKGYYLVNIPSYAIFGFSSKFTTSSVFNNVPITGTT